MASNYEVNIKLNTTQVKKDLKTIGDGINNLGKKQSKGAKSALSDAEQALKVKNTQLGLENKILRIQNSLGPLSIKNIKQTKVMNHLNNAQLKSDTKQFGLAKQSILLAEKELKTQKESLIANKGIEDSIRRQKLLRGGPTGFSAAQFGPQQPMQGPRFPTGARSGLNFDRFTGKLMQGPAGSSRRTLGNLGRRFDTQSALISGGFPLLFGQGPAGALAGGLGGGIGGMFGQMGGFAGGIAATALLQQITTLTQNIGDLGNALTRPTENIGTLVEKLGLVNDPTGRLALRLEKLGLASSASALLMREFTEQTGKSPDILTKAAQEINEMNKGMATLTLKFQLFVAKGLTPIIGFINGVKFDKLAELGKLALMLNNPAFAGEALRGQISRLGNVDFGPGKGRLFRPKGMSNIPAAEGNAIVDGIRINPNFGKTTPQIDSDSALEALAGQTEFNRNILPLQQSLELEKQRFSLSSQDLTVKREANKLDLKSKELELLKSQAAIKTNQDLDLKIEKLTAEVDLQRQIFENAQTLADPIKAQTIQLDQQMRVLMDRGSQIVALSQTISQSFERSFMGIINGTMSVNDAFRNMLGSIANHFAQTAAKMMANQVQRGLLGFLGNTVLGAFGGGGGASAPFITDKVFDTGFDTSLLDFSGRGFARGGRPPVGKASIVGERGPELFVPNMAGTIVPSNAMGGATNIVVNVDASGSSVEGDQGQANDLGNTLASAIQNELIKQKRPGGLLSNA